MLDRVSQRCPWRWELGMGERASLNPGKKEGKGCQAKGVNGEELQGGAGAGGRRGLRSLGARS